MDLTASCKKMELAYDELVTLKTKGELQGFKSFLGHTIIPFDPGHVVESKT